MLLSDKFNIKYFKLSILLKPSTKTIKLFTFYPKLLYSNDNLTLSNLLNEAIPPIIYFKLSLLIPRLLSEKYKSKLFNY